MKRGHPNPLMYNADKMNFGSLFSRAYSSSPGDTYGNYQFDHVRLHRTSIGPDTNLTAFAYIGPLMVWIY
ncbi:hypothetical protein AAES_17699 [Amazona aestiva]|uniref:Uncharacterized protein n=1 Tax=Amazona aestiva TaxID=12930 RepID=A0A0Q3X0R7_AMAAE|nr:hypothetical protein AAES_17699 [Amazona aestiva]